jgi:hypothetical protein
MRNYRTALGKNLDMSALVARNEKVRAVGNMKVNARGDTIDGMNRVIKTNTEKVSNAYSKTINRESSTPKKTVLKEQLTPDELALENSFDDDLEIEKIKAKDVNKNAR